MRRLYVVWGLLTYAGWSGEPKIPDIAPVVRSAVPAGADIGKTTDVVLRGRRLDGVKEIRFTTPHIRAEVTSHDYYEVKAKVTVDPEARPGLYTYRVIAAGGVYSARFHISATTSTLEAEPNNDIATAQKITLPAVVDGTIDEGDYDHFRFHADKGQAIVLDVVGNRASSNLDAKLAVINERGEQVAFNEDWHFGGDPHIAFTAPQAGDYVVQVSSADEGGDKDFSYRLIAGSYPWVDTAFPAALRRGTTGELELHGWNLDTVTEVSLGDRAIPGNITAKESGRLVVQFALDTSIETGIHQVFLKSGVASAPAPFLVAVSDLPEHWIAKPGTREHPEAIAVPTAVTGVLDRNRVSHFYSFAARAGERLTFKVDSMTLGYPLDAVVAIFDSSSRQLAFQDDPAPFGPKQSPEPDPRLSYTFERAGDYTVMIRDAGWKGDAEFVYRLSIKPAAPDYVLELANPSATLFRGQPNKIEVRVQRLDGWDTPVEVWLDDSPSGIEASKVTAEPKASEYKDNCAKLQKVDGTDVELVLRVDAQTAANLFPLKIRARGTMDGRTVERTLNAVYSTNLVSRMTDPEPGREFLAAVTDMPAAILQTPKAFGLTAGKTDKLKVTVDRFDGKSESVALQAEGLPEGVTLQAVAVPAGGARVELRFVTAKDAKPGKHPITLRAGETVSPKIELTIAAAKEEEKK